MPSILVIESAVVAVVYLLLVFGAFRLLIYRAVYPTWVWVVARWALFLAIALIPLFMIWSLLLMTEDDGLKPLF
ncbi:hypothetical protein D3Y59_14720 [Hymenobacter oligotrophus]|uniref:Uncharacterized protein n=1 Tax=Hymenobacter oligotrophus TaxID=2319843 RepID=A0A3B7R461_9BACT|nr:hypothetical protein D3Y59_14720 [Hymenobacter oligotrophus]